MASPFSNIAPTDLIRQLASPTPSGVGLVNPPRVDRVLQQLGVTNPFTGKKFGQNVDPAPKEKEQVIAVPNSGGASFVQLDRRPFALTCQQWLDSAGVEGQAADFVGPPRPKNGRYIYCRVNPRNVQWNLSLRVADQKTLAGTVQHAWRPFVGTPRRSYFSEPVLTITFQSGNIMPVRPDKFRDPNRPKQETGISQGLRNFYDFMDLLNASRIIDNGKDRRVNVVYILYTSHVFPSIVLAGLFTQDGITFNDQAENPNTIEWTTQFTVYDSYPRFDNGLDLIRSWNTTIPVFTRNETESTDNTPAEQTQAATTQPGNLQSSNRTTLGA